MSDLAFVAPYLLEEHPETLRPAPPRCPAADALRWRTLDPCIWLAELQAHLSTCPRCLRIQASLVTETEGKYPAIDNQSERDQCRAWGVPEKYLG